MDQESQEKNGNKKAGVTSAERYLSRLCEKNFLTLWSYCGVYRSQGGGKEIVDLLVVFENHIILFSDKDCIFPISGDVEKDWGRWFRRAIQASAKQVWGAERWVRAYPDSLFLDNKCIQPFPYALPDMADAQFHLIVVAHGVSRKIMDELGGTGSLMINSAIQGLDGHTMPFMIGDLDPAKTFVHIFDDTSLDIIMSALDTISDFVQYLSKKEKLLRSEVIVFSPGEEELLEHYLTHIDSDHKHDFSFPADANGVTLSEGTWEDFEKNPQRLAQLEADRVSYFWDDLIERFSHYALTDQQYFASSPGFQSSEKVLRLLAKLPRFHRRILSKGFLELIRKTPADQIGRKFVIPIKKGEPYYVMIVYPIDSTKTHDENRLNRRLYLEACCRVIKYKYPEAEHIAGIATESGIENGGRSEDAVYCDARIWSDDAQKEAEIIFEKLDILKNPTARTVDEKEYPEIVIDPESIPDNPRNKPCPCGSQKKYKKCHGNRV